MTRATIPAPRIDPADAAAAAARFGAGAPADVRYAVLDTPAGRVVAAATRARARPARLRGLERRRRPDRRSARGRLSPRILEQPRGPRSRRARARPVLRRPAPTFDLALDWSLWTPFARRVLRATQRIPYGQVATYGEVAERAGSPGGSRAAGNALGSNPMPIVVPCHRVVRAGGALGGYTGGVERKELLLGLEHAATAA